jgi:hypothetical protein
MESLFESVGNRLLQQNRPEAADDNLRKKVRYRRVSRHEAGIADTSSLTQNGRSGVSTLIAGYNEALPEP